MNVYGIVKLQRRLTESHENLQVYEIFLLRRFLWYD